MARREGRKGRTRLPCEERRRGSAPRLRDGARGSTTRDARDPELGPGAHWHLPLAPQDAAAPFRSRPAPRPLPRLGSPHNLARGRGARDPLLPDHRGREQPDRARGPLVAYVFRAISRARPLAPSKASAPGLRSGERVVGEEAARQGPKQILLVPGVPTAKPQKIPSRRGFPLLKAAVGPAHGKDPWSCSLASPSDPFLLLEVQRQHRYSTTSHNRLNLSRRPFPQKFYGPGETKP